MLDEKENIQNYSNTMKSRLEDVESQKFKILRILKDKELLSEALTDKLDQLNSLKIENERIKVQLKLKKEESKELISHGLEYLESSSDFKPL